MDWKFSNQEAIFSVEKKDDIPFLSIVRFQEYGFLKQAFSTRMGGVSEGEFSSMNLSFARGDKHLAVYENFNRITKAMGTSPKSIVFSKQTHTNQVVRVDKSHTGKISKFHQECLSNEGIRNDHSLNNTSKIYAFEDVDGMITNEPGVCLFTSYADCVPLYFVDPVKKAIGLSHSGWSGTVKKIGAVTVNSMVREFHSDPKDIIVAIGPCICPDCYEVSEDVIKAFLEALNESDDFNPHIKLDDSDKDSVPFLWDKDSVDEFAFSKGNGKYQLDLRKANELLLLEAGIVLENIVTTNVCTACNHEVLFSHRASKGKRGNLGAVLMIREEK